jgi:hypothetical protein
VTISLSLRHPQWGPLALPRPPYGRCPALLYVRRQTIATIPKCRRWQRSASKLQLAARLVEWIVPLLKKSGKTVWIVIDGGYTKRPFLKRALKSGVTIVGCLRKDAALRDLPPKPKIGPTPRPGPTAQVWQAQNQPGQTSGAETRLAERRLHGLWQSGHQDVRPS